MESNQRNHPNRRDPFSDDPAPIAKRERVSFFRRLLRRRFTLGLLLLVAILLAYGYPIYLRNDRKEKVIARFEANGGYCYYSQNQSIGGFEDLFRKILPRSYFDDVVGVQFGRVTDESIEVLSKLEFPRPIQHLDFTGKEVSESCFQKLSEIDSIVSLNFTYSKVSGKRLAYLSKLKALSSLGMRESSITDADTVYLKDLTSLTNLGLSHNDGLTDVCIEHLSELKSLKYLQLNDTKVSAEGLEKLRKALPDCEIYLPYPDPPE